MPRKVTELEFSFDVEFVAVPVEPAGISLLLEILKSEEPIYEQMGIDSDYDDHLCVVVDGHALSANRVFQGQDA